jgi:hypothetical protein
MAWCGGLVPTTDRSMNQATSLSLRGLTLNGPLQKKKAVMDRDVVDDLSQHKTDQCNDVQVGER